jgi:predicted nucleic-acid-binding protein
MIGLDTNCVLRYLLRDYARQASAVAARIDQEIEAGHALLINDIVLAEFVWTLGASYDFDRARIAVAIERMTASAHFAFEHKPDVHAALALFRVTSAGFVDCLIAAKNQRLGCRATLTFDKSARRVAGFDAV